MRTILQSTTTTMMTRIISIGNHFQVSYLILCVDLIALLFVFFDLIKIELIIFKIESNQSFYNLELC